MNPQAHEEKQLRAKLLQEEVDGQAAWNQEQCNKNQQMHA